MTEYRPGGRRRVDRVLDPGFLTGLDALTLDDLRDRRTDAEQEEVDLSYARRLLQGRVDILRAEQERRHDGGGARTPRTDAELVADLTRALADPGPRSTKGLGRHLGSLEPTRVGEHRREAERAVADLAGSDPAVLDDVALGDAVSRLVDIESRVSRTRRQVQVVVDTLTEEIARRYASGQVEVTLG